MLCVRAFSLQVSFADGSCSLQIMYMMLLLLSMRSSFMQVYAVCLSSRLLPFLDVFVYVGCWVDNMYMDKLDCCS